MKVINVVEVMVLALCARVWKSCRLEALSELICELGHRWTTCEDAVDGPIEVVASVQGQSGATLYDVDGKVSSVLEVGPLGGFTEDIIKWTHCESQEDLGNHRRLVTFVHSFSIYDIKWVT